jgi:hypothetical protein
MRQAPQPAQTAFSPVVTPAKPRDILLIDVQSCLLGDENRAHKVRNLLPGFFEQRWQILLCGSFQGHRTPEVLDILHDNKLPLNIFYQNGRLIQEKTELVASLKECGKPQRIMALGNGDDMLLKFAGGLVDDKDNFVLLNSESPMVFSFLRSVLNHEDDGQKRPLTRYAAPQPAW